MEPLSGVWGIFKRYCLFAIAILIAAIGAVGVVALTRDQPPPRQHTALFTSLPILWGEAGDMRDLLKTDAPPHWVRTALEARGPLQPLDTLTNLKRLPARTLLVIAQPRPLSPEENVALEDWVRGGGRVLLFADPLLTAHSAYALGDPRRPQDVVLLSPILTRWGLELRFDEAQPAGEHSVEWLGENLPVDLPGHFAVKNPAACRTEAGGLVARCRIGAGRVLAVGDAALLDLGIAGDDRARRAALDRLLDEAAR